MIRINGSLVVSVVKWSSDPPLHEVSAILCSPDGRDLVSASIDGNMILWSVDSNAEFKPKWMISGHRSHVKNLCLAGIFQSENRKLFFSHSATSEMALWDWNNGKCLEFKIDTRYRHTHIKSHQPTFLDYRLLFCCGQYPHIVIIHATSLVVLFNLTSQSKPDWISNFAVVSHPNRQHEVVLGVSASNVAALWTLNGDEVQDETKYEHESLVIDCLSPIVQVDCCSQTPRCILMVSSFGWQLFDAMVCSVALLQPTTKQDPLVGGEFVGSDSVVVYCRSGVALLYRIEMRHQAEPSAPLSFEPPVLLMRFLPPTNGDDIVSSENGFCQFSVIHTSNMPVLLGGTLNGEILRWNLADEPKTETHSPVDKYPNIITGLVDIWRRNPPHPFLRNLSCETTNDVRAPEPSVTVCIQLFRTSALKPRDTRPHRVAFGLSDGSIIVMRLTDFMQAAYWTSDFRANSNTPNANHLLHLTRFKLTGHVGPVTSLLHPASANTQFIHTLDHDSTVTKCPYDWDHLVSGGADFTVRLWDLDPWREAGLDRVQDRRNRLLSDRLASCITPPTCLSVFHCHSSPCISLFIGPPTCAVLSSCAGNSRLNSCVGSVGSDGSVSIISLHEQRVLLSTSPPCKLSPSPVIALGWRVPEDLLLVVHADWGLEIWDIASGILDR
ncbi:unnamed protein product [Dicrocoelium dendriticum]|nr:unnamed protein product [Dicrocoelium dendriticum]